MTDAKTIACTACAAPAQGWRMAGLYDTVDTPDELQQGQLNSPLYWSGAFLPLGLTVCERCGHADLWSLASLAAMPRDSAPREVFTPPQDPGNG